MKKLFPILAILMICSCSQKQEKPQDVLGPEKMAQVLLNVYQNEAVVRRINVPRDSAIILLRHYQLRMYDSLAINDSIYYKSYRYYMDHPKEFEQIYDVVIDSMNLRNQTKRKIGRN